tara:strand:+ start:643 stop:894 length:252 start_codon:yes stop_codon:yes gene_type:complete
MADPLKHFWPEYEIEVIEWADYRFRITIPKGAVVQVLTGIIESVGYTGFKNACDDDEYHRSLVRVWNIMYNYQSRLETRPRRS